MTDLIKRLIRIIFYIPGLPILIGWVFLQNILVSVVSLFNWVYGNDEQLEIDKMLFKKNIGLLINLHKKTFGRGRDD